MKVRKAVFVLMLFALCLLGGCVQKNQQTEEEAEETPLIGISIYRYDDGFMKLYRDELEKMCIRDRHQNCLFRSKKGGTGINGFIGKFCNCLFHVLQDSNASG